MAYLLLTMIQNVVAPLFGCINYILVSDSDGFHAFNAHVSKPSVRIHRSDHVGNFRQPLDESVEFAEYVIFTVNTCKKIKVHN